MSTLARVQEVFAGLRQRFTRPAELQVSRVPGSELPPGLERIRDQVLIVGLKRLLSEKHFSICRLEALIEAARIVADGDVMRLLRPLHCVDWADMPVELRREVSALIVAMFTPAPEPTAGGPPA